MSPRRRLFDLLMKSAEAAATPDNLCRDGTLDLNGIQVVALALIADGLQRLADSEEGLDNARRLANGLTIRPDGPHRR